tara:strand:- start:107 stop:574 length:468 start_codon:yes stop_codon:yes gene_type:complete
MRQRLNSIRGLQPRTVLGANEQIIDTHTDGRPIIQRTFTKEVRVPVLDKDGEQVWKMNQLGVKTVPVFKLVPEEVTETYVYDELRTGHNMRNYHFREDSAEVEARAKRARVSKLQEEFFAVAEDRGLSAAEIADFVAEGKAEKVKPKTKAKAAKT